MEARAHARAGTPSYPRALIMKKTNSSTETGVKKMLSGQNDPSAAIQKGLDQARVRMGRPVDDVFDDLERAMPERKSKREAESARDS